ncbi:MAG: polysaccharide pyruvyl transferase family protein [Muribaculaceae bacterium]|nr:polysaccharide pyruvyl transferase family protein [Muribaculaceae bacterium]
MRYAGIVTHYDVHNHGALLQLMALIRVLKQKNIEARALRFDKNYDFLGHSLKAKYEISSRSLSIYLKYLKQKGIVCTAYNFKKRNTLYKFKETHNLVGDYYSESPELDMVIIGSDEVFALHTGPTPAFFGHCLPSDKVISYAGSFGPTTIEEIDRRHSREFIESGLKRMKAVTVRDSNSASIVEALTGKTPAIVVDPVILYGYEEEIKALDAPNISDYLLVYAYDNRINAPEETLAIIDYARSKNLKIVSAGFYHSWCDINVNVDPLNLLAYFKYAKEVITDTFHGSIMSMITGAKFAVKTWDSNHLKLSSLLKDFGLENRIFLDWSDIEKVITPPIDYKEVNDRIKIRRDDSMALLDRMINL